MKNGLFLGLITLDLIYLVTNFPEKNEKVVACNYTVTAGGPATNAAVTYNYLGNLTTLVGVIGNSHITNLIWSDLKQHQLKVLDLNPNDPEPPPVSSIIITQKTGERAVISINSTKNKIQKTDICDLDLEGIDLILIDGHQMAVSQGVVLKAKARNIPIVVDGGSWKPGFEQVLASADYVICSANFYPPGCKTQENVLAYLSHLGIPHIAITQGEKPILYQSRNERGEVSVPQIKSLDTVGAGDIFHGAFCHYIGESNFKEALVEAAKIASYSCQFFGTREWMAQRANNPLKY